jgi:hypothetical protein
VQNHALKRGVLLVMMRLPILWNHVNFDVARARFLLAKLNDGPPKIRTSLVIPETRMKDAQRLAIGGAEFVAEETLVVPDVLQQAFRWMKGIAFPQEGTGLLVGAPLFIKIRPENGHAIRFQSGPFKVKIGVGIIA